MRTYEGRWVFLTALVLAVACAIPGEVSAFIDVCVQTGPADVTDVNGNVPAHIQPGDDVWYRVKVDWGWATPYSGPPQVVLVRTTRVANDVSIDVIVTTDPSHFPDYQVATLRGEPSNTVNAVGDMGQFSVGNVQIESAVRTYDAQSRTFTTPCGLGRGYSGFKVYPTAGTAPVVEFYNPAQDHYFITQSADEIRDLESGVHPGWTKTGQSFLAYLPGQSSYPALPIVRWYGVPSAGLDTHFYTYPGPGEEFYLVTGAARGKWEWETDDAFELIGPDLTTGTCPAGTMAVYRLWNARLDTNHRYTSNPAVKAQMIAKGYVAEGWGDDDVFFCAPNE